MGKLSQVCLYCATALLEEGNFHVKKVAGFFGNREIVEHDGRVELKAGPLFQCGSDVHEMPRPGKFGIR